MQKPYRIVPPMDIRLNGAFVDRFYAEISADKPDHASCFEGEWVCSHWPCPVRSVRLRVKAMLHQQLPRLRCPLCLRALDFRHWLNAAALRSAHEENEEGGGAGE